MHKELMKEKGKGGLRRRGQDGGREQRRQERGRRQRRGREDDISGSGGCPWANLTTAQDQSSAKSTSLKLLSLGHHPRQWKMTNEGSLESPFELCHQTQQMPSYFTFHICQPFDSKVKLNG